MKKYISCSMKLAAMAAIMIATTAVKADDPDKTPTAISILKKFSEASGGAAKFKEIKAMKMTGNLEIAAAGINGTIEIIQQSPNKIATKAEMDGVGSQSQGSNGEIGWELSTMMGPRLLDKKELVRLIEQADLSRYYDPENFYKEMKVDGMKEIDGEKCYKLVLTHKAGHKTTEFYSVKTGLQVASEATIPSPMGEMDIVTSINEYKEIGGLKFPAKIESKFPNGMSQVVSMDTIEINPKVDANAFAIPSEVQGLVDETKDK